MKSMTGFGKKTIQNENYQLDVEVKSVNQRFLDIQLRMPKELNAYELVIRQVIKRTLKRGRVEVMKSPKLATIKKKCACSGT